ncbi:MAG: Holliday junction branch migration protein RuvA [Actinomycetes bacterium]
MIGSLRGTVGRSAPGEIVIDVAGVGYRVIATPSTTATLVSADGEVSVSVHTHVREDAIVLFGFATDSERQIFEILLGTHGVGPSLALAILGSLGDREVARAIRESDAGAFETVTGVGKKTAARLVLELQGSLGDLGVTPSGSEERGSSSVVGEVSEALGELGYSPDEIRAAVRDLSGDEDVQTGLRLALRELRRA